jgi:hypothetical protein
VDIINIPYMYFNNLYATSAQQVAQMNAGCQLLLTYEDATHVRLKSTASSISVILPNLGKVIVTSTGFTSTFTGSISTFYYVYLKAGPSLEFSTSAPDTSYTNQKTLSTNKVLVGYAGLSASNTMAGVWNVFSFYGEPERTWSTSITGAGSTYAAATMNGLVVPASKTAVITRSGSTTINIDYEYGGGVYLGYHVSGSVSIGSWTAECQENYPPNSYSTGGWTYTVSKTHSDMGEGVYNLSNIGISCSALSSTTLYSYTGSPPCNFRAAYRDTSSTPYCSAYSGAVTLTRSAS